ncbi:Uncharacterised protein [uncultured archaeon]|nr:Uncharacterised protein [uncultured archaeon]
MDVFLLKLIVTFIVGGVWITFATVLAEKYGTKLGGMIVGLPSTGAIALFFIGWTQTPLVASQATTLIPIIGGINSFFVVIYLLLSKKNFYLGIVSALAFWFIFSLSLVKINFNNFFYSLLGLVVLALPAYYILEKKSEIKSEEKRIISHTAPQLLFRALLGGSVIALSVILAKTGGPLLGSAFATFPAVFLGTIIVTHFSCGKSFSAAVMKVAVISGNVNLTVYAIAVRYLYPPLGLILGTITSFAISLVTGYLLYKFVNKRMD